MLSAATWVLGTECGCWEQNVGTLQEQLALLAAELSFQLHG